MLTHDAGITKRHYEDEKDNIRAIEVSFRFAKSLQTAQEGLAEKMTSWRYPTFAVVAGDDKLADAHASESMLKSISPSLLDYHFYPENYHENFNELNCEKIFADILCWLEKRLTESDTHQARRA